MSEPKLSVAFLTVCLGMGCSTTNEWSDSLPPKAVGQVSIEERESLYRRYEILDWSGLGVTGFHLRSPDSNVDQSANYRLESLLPLIEDVAPYLKDDLNEIQTYDRYGRIMAYSSFGLLGLAAGGLAMDEKQVYFTARNLGIFTLFLAVVLEHFEWQIMGQVQYQYNEALRDRLGLIDQQVDDENDEVDGLSLLGGHLNEIGKQRFQVLQLTLFHYSF